ncbi:hypothetical protein LZP73_00525 [Shewanella sp. AS16]|uniref:hypothetical protein n=1 Tax=Shewanella sp. AS16 TaxID=2907625 RepID=UPI001F421AF5|nr:hypothetical protein [Shewanella sp. AS16]MCE9684705.1 hypothetical protein [Shewanella sp. AS16]
MIRVVNLPAPRFHDYGIAKVTGQKVYGRDYRAMDASHTYLGLDLSYGQLWDLVNYLRLSWSPQPGDLSLETVGRLRVLGALGTWR